jgi:protocatechuate 3,4-dioxygenase beta subunit
MVRDRDPEELTVHLDTGATLVGRVTPAGAAEVSLEADPATLEAAMIDRSFRAERALRTRAAADGSFRLAGVPAGRWRLRGEREGGSGSLAVTVREGAQQEVTLALEEAARVVGRVLDEAGRPVVGVTVRLIPSDLHPGPLEAGLWRLRRAHNTDGSPSGAKGEFAFAAVRPGAYMLSAADERGQRWSGATARDAQGRPRAIQVPANGELRADLVLQAQDGQLRGRVVDASGQAVPEAIVRLHYAGSWLSDGSFEVMLDAGVEPAVTADERGLFVVGGLRGGTYDLIAEAPHGGGSGAASRVAVGANVTVVVQAPGTLTGSVSGVGAGPCLVRLDGPTSRVERSLVDDCRFVAAGLQPGHYRVDATTERGEVTGEVEVAVGAQATLALPRPRAGGVRGAITAGDRARVASLPVLVSSGAQSEISAWAARLLRGEAPRTGPNGQFLVEGIAPGPRAIVIFSPDLGQVIWRGSVEVPVDSVVDIGTVQLDDATVAKGATK